MVKMRLKELLLERGISMSKLSRMSDISFSTISRICNDEKYSPTLATLERIASALDADISELYKQTSNK